MTKTLHIKTNGWGNSFAEILTEGSAYLSVVFSWQMQDAYQRAVWLAQEGYEVSAGGPAVQYRPKMLEGVARLPAAGLDALPYHNPDATFTSRGCIRKCEFCIVPKIEGDIKECDDWEPKPIVCDNNLLACSRAHFDRVIDRLKPLKGIDFNQGLDARLLLKHHADRLAELDLAFVRLAWDDVRYEQSLNDAITLLRAAHIPKHKIRIYVLIGFKDTPDDALYRLQQIKKLGLMPNPMRYQPLDSNMRDSYVGPGWTKAEITRYMRYWCNLAHTGGIPFDEFA